MTDELENYPYAEKRKKAEKIAKRLIHSDDLGRDVELEVLDESDKVLADLVRNSLSKLRETHLASGIKMIQCKEDLDKLSAADKATINGVLDQLGGHLPPGGLVQVKLNSVKGLDAAVDTVIINGTINLSSLIVSRLAAVRATAVADAVAWLVDRAHELQVKLPNLKGAAKAETADVLKRIDGAITATFNEKDYDAAIALYKELGAEKAGVRTKQ